MTCCGVCFRRCPLEEGQIGDCGARICRGGKVEPLSYGAVSSMALDPVEKKPFSHFMPGSRVLSLGGYGCNLRCPFCQNSAISWSQEALEELPRAAQITPEKLCGMALSLVDRGNIGAAFTYNEPLVAYEFVRDASVLLHRAGLKSLMVTNGTASLEVLRELEGLVDAMNIDLKGFTRHFYRHVLQGSLDMVQEFIAQAVTFCHVELTVLVIPGMNDSREEMAQAARWIASLRDREGRVMGSSVPLHINRFFPRFRMSGAKPTDPAVLYDLARIAGEHLEHVHVGNC